MFRETLFPKPPATASRLKLHRSRGRQTPANLTDYIEEEFHAPS